VYGAGLRAAAIIVDEATTMPALRKCSHCRVMKPDDAAHFYHNHGGLSAECKECGNKRNAAARKARAGAGTKICAACKRDLPRTARYYRVWASAKDGLSSRCLWCAPTAARKAAMEFGMEEARP
jgi:hypothetical protein